MCILCIKHQSCKIYEAQTEGFKGDMDKSTTTLVHFNTSTIGRIARQKISNDLH